MTDQPKPAASRLAWVLLIATAVVVTAAGIVLLALAAAAPQSGWFAYAPLSGQVFRPPTASIDLLRTLGFILIVLGVAVAAATLGFRAGRRSALRRPT